jgi:hypothetical protein
VKIEVCVRDYFSDGDGNWVERSGASSQRFNTALKLLCCSLQNHLDQLFMLSLVKKVGRKKLYLHIQMMMGPGHAEDTQ